MIVVSDSVRRVGCTYGTIRWLWEHYRAMVEGETDNWMGAGWYE